MNIKNYLYYTISILALVICSCDSVDNEIAQANDYNFEINKVLYDSLHYHWERIYDYHELEPVDSLGIQLYTYDDEYYYNPVQIAWTCLKAINSYEITDSIHYFNYAKSTALTMIDKSIHIDNTVYFPYNFPFRLHGLPDQEMIVPWVSGMAQGLYLSIFSRLYYLSQDEDMLDYAEIIYTSYSNVNTIHWSVFINEENYYWISEYPMDDKNYTLNGFMFGIYGLYDYWFVTNDSEIATKISMSWTTLKDYVELFRCPGDLSYYCLKHQVQKDTYHRIHIEQLIDFGEYTGDVFFTEMADTFLSDYNPYPVQEFFPEVPVPNE